MDAFQEFFATRLRPEIPRVMRRRHYAWLATMAVTVATCCAAMILFYHFPSWFGSPPGQPGGRNWFSMGLFACVFALAAGYATHGWLRASFLCAFHQRILVPIARFVCPGLTFQSATRLPAVLYERSLLFDAGPDSWWRHLAAGVFSLQVKGRECCFASLKAERTVRHGCRLRRSLVQGGMFLLIKDLHDATGFVLSVPKASGMNQEVMEARLKALDRSGAEEVKAVNNPEFNLAFVSFSDRRSRAESVLAPGLTDLLLAIPREHAMEPYFSLFEGRLHLALASNRAHFSPPPMGQKLDLAACLEYRDDIALCLALASSLT